jgi:integrase/recombinase XerD
MNGNTVNKSRKRGKRLNSLDVPQRFLDHLTPSVLEISQSRSQQSESVPPDVWTLDKLFSRYYTARQAAGAAQRTLEDYCKHMIWFKRFLALEYNGLQTFMPNRDVIRTWISHMLMVQKLKPSTINIRLRTVKAMFNWAVTDGVLDESPFSNVNLLRVPEEDFQVITKLQERRLFDVCDVHSFVGLRDALLMSFLCRAVSEAFDSLPTGERLLDDVDGRLWTAILQRQGIV